MEKIGAARVLSKDTLRQWTSGRRLALACLVIAGLTALTWWIAQVHQRSQVRELLNKAGPIVSPPMELQFAARQPDSPDRLAVLAPGERAGYWIVRHNQPASEVDVLLTRTGQKYFSVVGKSVVATFHAGTRQITSVDGLKDSDTTREVSFTYIWTVVQPPTAVLGAATPSLGREYKGEAILVRSAGTWQLAHWSMPEFEEAISQFH